MDGNYIFLADLLNKFIALTPAIQVVWMVGFLLLFLMLNWLLREILVALIQRQAQRRGELLYSIRRDFDNQLLVYYHGEDTDTARTGGVIILPDKIIYPPGEQGGVATVKTVRGAACKKAKSKMAKDDKGKDEGGDTDTGRDIKQ